MNSKAKNWIFVGKILELSPFLRVISGTCLQHFVEVEGRILANNESSMEGKQNIIIQRC